MPVPTLITELSTTANSNSPAGSESPVDGDNYLRAHGAFIAQLNANKLDKAGTVTLTANQPMGGFKHTGAAAATDSGQYVVWGQTAAVNLTGPASSAVALTVGDQSTDGRIAIAAAGLNLSRGNWLSVGSGELAAPTGAMSIGTVEAGAVNIYTDSALRVSVGATGNVITSVLTSPPSLTVNGQMVFNLTSDTNLRISVRGSDGVTRVANVTLA